jgi:mono/diheme cytochrome c family protein
MSFVRRNAVPFAAGLAAAAAAFAVVLVTTDDDGGGDGRAPEGGEVAAPAPAAPAEPVPAGQEAGLAVFTRMGCGGCHTLAAAGSTGPIGPDLDQRLPNHTPESLTAVIVTPPAGSIMPDNFGDRMSDDELATLVDFLLAVREPR